MQRLMNDPDFIVDDMLAGYAECHPEITMSAVNPRVLHLRRRSPHKVGLVSGGGSGHEPAFLGYVGTGALDAVAVGEVFSSPPASAFLEAIRCADTGSGVVCLYGNYAGDNMNARRAAADARKEGIHIELIVATDDIASAPRAHADQRYGIAGGYFLWKIAGAAAAQGAGIDEVARISKDAAARTRTICVGLEPCVIPAVGHPNFSIASGTIELGVGHHGESGQRVQPLSEANAVAADMVDAVATDLDNLAEEELAVMVSGLGATPLMELYVLYHGVLSEFSRRGIRVGHSHVGNFVTSLNMNGASLTVLALNDELLPLLEYPAQPSGFKTYSS